VAPVIPSSGARRPGLREVLTHPLGPTAWDLNLWMRSSYVPELRSDGEYAPPITEDLQRRLIEIARLKRSGLNGRVAARLSLEGTVRRDGVRVIPTGEPGVTIIVQPPDRVVT
jgi:hypothetical protein